MSQELVSLLKRTLRMPWEIQARPQKLDDVISSRLVSECGFSRQFKAAPKNEDQVVQSIVLPTLLTLIKSRAKMVSEAGIWKDLPVEQKRAIVRHYGLRDQYIFVTHLVPDVLQINPLASYIGACFAFTVKAVPMFVDFGQIVDAALAWENKEHSAFKEIEQSGLLVVRGFLGKHQGAYKVEGAIFSLLAKRADCNLPTVFLEVPSNTMVSNSILRGREITVELVESMFAATDVGKSRLGHFLFGMNTYINFNSNARAFNDSRFGLSV